MTALRAWAFVALVGPSLAAQQPPTRGEIDTHRVTVHSERVIRFLEDYAARRPEVQRLADFELEKRKLAGASIEWTPNDEALYFAWRQLLDEEGEGGQMAEAAELHKIAAAFDLAIVPGVFAAREEGLGEALTVHVRTLVPTTTKRDFTLALEWITPSAGQQSARREPIGAGALRDGGFEMYLRAPPSKAGTWQLFGLVTRDAAGAVAGSVPAVAVDCIAELATRAERALAPREGEPPGRAHLRRTFELLRSFGVRSTPSTSAGRTLELLEAWSAAEPPADVPLPTELAFLDAAGYAHWAWAARPSYAARGTLLLLASQSECADTVFARSLGARWLALAHERELRVRAVHLPYDLKELAKLLDRERASCEGELVVVARGDTLGRLGAAMQGREKFPFDALVMSTVVATDSPEVAFAGVDRLLVAPGAAKRKPDAERFAWVEGAWIPLLNEPRLPELVGAWLAQRAAARKEQR